jgi:hypothetical protein
MPVLNTIHAVSPAHPDCTKAPIHIGDSAVAIDLAASNTTLSAEDANETIELTTSSQEPHIHRR